MAATTLLGRAALAFAGRGWHVLPVAGKLPRTAHGVHDATTDPAVISGWWQRWPDAGVGIACGPSGLLVVDLDGPHATTTWRDLCDAHGKVPTRTAKTSRGWHLYYHQPATGADRAGAQGADAGDGTGAGVGNSAGRLAAGIDVRGVGGYVIAPPSPHPSGGVYAWHVPAGQTRPLPLAPAPAWLIDQLTAAQMAPAQVGVAPAAGVRVSVSDAYLRAAVEGEAAKVAAAAEGRRNHTLNAAAYALAGLGVPDEVIRDRLTDAAHAAGLTPLETARTITSGITAGLANPRTPHRHATTGVAATAVPAGATTHAAHYDDTAAQHQEKENTMNHVPDYHHRVDSEVQALSDDFDRGFGGDMTWTEYVTWRTRLDAELDAEADTEADTGTDTGTGAGTGADAETGAGTGVAAADGAGETSHRYGLACPEGVVSYYPTRQGRDTAAAGSEHADHPGHHGTWAETRTHVYPADWAATQDAARLVGGHAARAESPPARLVAVETAGEVGTESVSRARFPDERHIAQGVNLDEAAEAATGSVGARLDAGFDDTELGL